MRSQARAERLATCIPLWAAGKPHFCSWQLRHRIATFMPFTGIGEEERRAVPWWSSG